MFTCFNGPVTSDEDKTPSACFSESDNVSQSFKYCFCFQSFKWSQKVMPTMLLQQVIS